MDTFYLDFYRVQKSYYLLFNTRHQVSLWWRKFILYIQFI